MEKKEITITEDALEKAIDKALDEIVNQVPSANIGQVVSIALLLGFFQDKLFNILFGGGQASTDEVFRS